MTLVFYRLNSAIERGTKPDALGSKPCHWTSTLKAAMVKAKRASISSAAASYVLLTRGKPRRQASMSPHRLTQQPRPRSRTLQTEAVGVASIVGLPGEHRGMGCGAQHIYGRRAQWRRAHVGGAHGLAVRVSLV